MCWWHAWSVLLRACRGSAPAAVSRSLEPLLVAGPAGMMSRELALLAQLKQAASAVRRTTVECQRAELICTKNLLYLCLRVCLHSACTALMRSQGPLTLPVPRLPSARLAPHKKMTMRSRLSGETSHVSSEPSRDLLGRATWHEDLQRFQLPPAV